MRGLFYAIVEYITECITGIENGSIKLWELNTYLMMSNRVTMWMNIVVAVVLCLVIAIVALEIYEYYLLKKLEDYN